MEWADRKKYYNKWYFTDHGHFITDDDTANYINGANDEGFKKIANFLYNLCQPKSILECGCANGSLEYAFYLINLPIIKGFDISEYAISAVPEYIKNAVFVNDITEGIPFNDREFELVVLFDILEHLHNYELLDKSVREACRVCEKYILIRTPMIVYAHTAPTYEERIKDEVDLLMDLNNISHEARIELVGIHPLLKKPCPCPTNIEHPLEHPREFWVKLIESYGFKEKKMPDEYYKYPNPLIFLSFNAAFFERI